MSRSSTLHKSTVGLLGAATAVLAATSLAFACTGAPSVTFRGTTAQGTPSSSAGPAGSEVNLEGREWQQGPVDIRWNSAVGQLLAQPSGPSFNVAVTIPGTAEPGVYTIYLVQQQSVARASFEVTPTTSPTSGSGPGQTRTGQNSASTSGEETQQPRTSSGTGSVAVPSQGGTQSFATPSDAEPATSDAATAQRAGSQPTSAGPGASPARAQSPAARAGAPTAPAGQPVFSGSVATSGAAPSATPAGSADDQTAKAPAANTVSGDLYSGFNAASDASLLPNVADSARNSGGPAGQAALAMGIFSASLVALFGGFAAAEAKRRKVSSRAS